MSTSRETILAALHARLSALPATAPHGEVLPERVPADGLLILRDGKPEVTLSPLRYHYQHHVKIETTVQGTDRDSGFDTLAASIGAGPHLPPTARLAGSVTGSRPKPRGRSICRSRARALMAFAFETTYGTPPVGSFTRMPFANSWPVPHRANLSACQAIWSAMKLEMK